MVDVLDPLANQKLLDWERTTCREDPMYFRHRIYSYDKIGKDFHYEIDSMLNRKGRYKLLMIPRNHYKTTQVMSWLHWKILNDPDISILYETSVALQAKKSVLEVRRAFESSDFSELFGEWRGQPWEDYQFTVASRKRYQAAPTLSASGLDRTQTGQHYDIIVLDDLVDEHNHRTHEGREIPKERLRDAINLLRPNGTLICIGTPWDPEDYYSFIEGTPEIDKVFDKFKLSIFRKDGTLLMPEEFCSTVEEEILTGKRSLEMLRIINGPVKFSAQYLCNIKGIDISEFQSSWFKHASDEEVRDLMRDRRTRGNVVLFCDPAMGRETSLKPCDTAIVGAHFMRNRMIDVFYTENGLIDPGTTIAKLHDLAVQCHADTVQIEDVGFQATMVTALEALRDEQESKASDYWYYDVKPVSPRAAGDKERRIRSLFPYYRFGQVRHAESLRNGELENQLKRFPKGSKRDVVDAFSQFTFSVDFPSRPPLASGAASSIIPASRMVWSQRAPAASSFAKKEGKAPGLGKDFFDIG